MLFFQTDEWPRRDLTVAADFNERERISVFQNTGSGRASRGMEIRLWQEL